ncbi:exopolysaccharide biosynthesis protein [Mangrovicoccus ximenensis]|uniref:exopolysaccharide biosynthesis protein n=1 Tax=Mangrovicoccus ximenensis TaxID=1911570 RepID=UPI001374DC89|nr:exopolysaccharide biosynthesis protein [Mangrovicoccus ximenensis]
MQDAYFDKLVVGLGAMKGASTWLSYNLAKSPQIDMPPPKELHYFHATARWTDGMTSAAKLRKLLPFRGWTGSYLDPAFRQERAGRFRSKASRPLGSLPDWRQDRAAERLRERAAWYDLYETGTPSPEWYRALFPKAGPQVWALDFSNTYGMLHRRDLLRIRSMARETRAICILRNPYDRLWSHLRFDAQTEGRLDELSGLSAQRLVRLVRARRFDAHSLYAPRLERALEVFGRERLLVLSHDDIRTDPAAALASVTGFLGIPPIRGRRRMARPRNVTAAMTAPPAASPDRPPDHARLRHGVPTTGRRRMSVRRILPAEPSLAEGRSLPGDKAGPRHCGRCRRFREPARPRPRLPQRQRRSRGHVRLRCRFRIICRGQDQLGEMSGLAKMDRSHLPGGERKIARLADGSGVRQLQAGRPFRCREALSGKMAPTRRKRCRCGHSASGRHGPGPASPCSSRLRRACPGGWLPPQSLGHRPIVHSALGGGFDWLRRHLHIRCQALSSGRLSLSLIALVLILAGGSLLVLGAIPVATPLVGLPIAIFATGILSRDGAVVAAGWAVLALSASTVLLTSGQLSG